MTDLTLTKIHRLNVFEMVSALDLNHSEFRWEEVDSHQLGSTQISKLNHMPTGYFFEFDFESSRAVSRFSPNFNRKWDIEFHDDNWNERAKYVKNWLVALKMEILTIDPWTELTKSSELLRAANDDGSDNSVFTDVELKAIADGLKEIREYLTRVHDISFDIVEKRMTYLAEASTRLGRKDWKNILIAVLIDIVVDAYLPAETTREIFSFAYTALKSILTQQFLLN